MSKLSPSGVSKTPVTDKMKAKRLGKQIAAFAAGGTLVLSGLFAAPTMANASNVDITSPNENAIVVQDNAEDAAQVDVATPEVTTPEVLLPTVDTEEEAAASTVAAPQVAEPATPVVETAPQTPVTAEPQSKAESRAAISTPDGGSIYKDVPSLTSNLLGAAANFHVFANDVVPGAHLNGNFAAKNFYLGYGGSEFGTHGAIQKDYVYMQNILGFGNTKLHNGSKDNFKLVFGEGVNVTGDSNSNMFKANGHDFQMAPVNLFKDGKGMQYINFETEFNNLRSTSKTINQKSKAATQGVINVPKGSTGNSYTIDVSKVDTNYVYVNIDAKDLEQGILHIKGLEKAKPGETTPPKSVFFNVTFSGGASYWPVSSMVHESGYHIGKHITLQYTDGTSHTYAEHTKFEANTLLWNMNTTKPLYLDGQIGGAILAPDSYMAVLGGSFDGTAAVKKFFNQAETHRWDFQGGETDVEVPPTTPGETEPPEGITPVVPPFFPEDPQGITPGVPPIDQMPEDPDFPTPTLPPFFPEDPTPITPGVPPIDQMPEDPDFPTPMIPPFFPEDPQGITPGVPPIDQMPEDPNLITPEIPPFFPTSPEDVTPQMPPLTPEGITPEVPPTMPQDVTPITPEVPAVVAEGVKDKLAQTGVDVKVGILAGIASMLVASAGYAASRLRRKEKN